MSTHGLLMHNCESDLTVEKFGSMEPLPHCTVCKLHGGGQVPFINTGNNTQWCTVNFTNKYWLYTNRNTNIFGTYFG